MVRVRFPAKARISGSFMKASREVSWDNFTATLGRPLRKLPKLRCAHVHQAEAVRGPKTTTGPVELPLTSMGFGRPPRKAQGRKTLLDIVMDYTGDYGTTAPLNSNTKATPYFLVSVPERPFAQVVRATGMWSRELGFDSLLRQEFRAVS